MSYLNYFHLVELVKPVETPYMSTPRTGLPSEAGSIGNIFYRQIMVQLGMLDRNGSGFPSLQK